MADSLRHGEYEKLREKVRMANSLLVVAGFLLTGSIVCGGVAGISGATEVPATEPLIGLAAVAGLGVAAAVVAFRSVTSLREPEAYSTYHAAFLGSVAHVLATLVCLVVIALAILTVTWPSLISGASVGALRMFGGFAGLMLLPSLHGLWQNGSLRRLAAEQHAEEVERERKGRAKPV